MKCKLYTAAIGILFAPQEAPARATAARRRIWEDAGTKSLGDGFPLCFTFRGNEPAYRNQSKRFAMPLDHVDTSGDDDEKKPLRSLKHVSNVEVMPLKHVPKKKRETKERGSKEDEAQSDVPRLPSGEFRPKQSLGQNFISDKNIMNRLCNVFDEEEGGHPDGRQVIEVGAGIGSLTHILHKKYPKMTAIEIDARAISQLSRTIPNLDVIHDDVLQVDYDAVSKVKETKLWVIGNLPFYITSQILFCLLDYKRVIDVAVVTAQLEVAQRIVAQPCEFEYSILSVVMQLYCKPKMLFKIPSHAFYPVPKVESGVIRLDFKQLIDTMKRAIKLAVKHETP